MRRKFQTKTFKTFFSFGIDTFDLVLANGQRQGPAQVAQRRVVALAEINSSTRNARFRIMSA